VGNRCQKHVFQSSRHRATVRIIQRYLSSGSRILEGGGGLGDVVHALNKVDYKVDGIDYAPKIVAAINESWPHLSVFEGDVRSIPVKDGHYDGYCSFGVIEHFADSYEAIAHEMKRVLRQGGYLFLSFPSFNRFRQSRAKAGKYVTTTLNPSDIPDFFQFALDSEQIQAFYESLGFELIEL